VEIYTWNYNHPFELILSQRQQEQFNAVFEQLTEELDQDKNVELFASLKRLAVSSLRIACVMQAVSRYENQITESIVTCDQEILEKSLAIAKILWTHTKYVYSTMDESRPKTQMHFLTTKLLDKLPVTFKASEAEAIADKECGIRPRTCRNHIKKLVLEGKLETVKFGEYKKIINKKISEDDNNLTNRA